MKNLKLVLFISTCVFMSEKAFSQTVTVRGGLNLANMLTDFEDEIVGNPNSKTRLSFQGGALFDYPIADNFYLETGMLFSSKGFRISEQESFAGISFSYESRMIINYIDIPLSAKAVFEVGDMYVYGSLGPYIGIGLTGNYTQKVSGMGQVEEDEIELDFDDDLQRFDYGLMFGAGVEFQNIVFGLSYGLGFQNVSRIEDTTLKNRVFSISLGYRFGDRY